MSQYRDPILQYTDCSSDRPRYILDLSSERSCKEKRVVIREALTGIRGEM